MSGLFKDFFFGQAFGTADIKSVVLMRPNLAKMLALVTFCAFDRRQTRVFHGQHGSDRSFIASDFFVFLLDRAVWVNIGSPFPLQKHLGIDKRGACVQKGFADIHVFTPFCS